VSEDAANGLAARFAMRDEVSLGRDYKYSFR